MSSAGAEGRVVAARIVFFGPAGAGTTTALETIARRLRADQRGTLARQAASTGPSALYEVLPVELGEVRGLHPRFHLTTVPGGPAHAAARRQLLKGVDGIVFVADSSPDRADATAAAMQELTAHLAAYGRSLETVPTVILLNKRDHPDAVPVEQLLKRLHGPQAPVFEAVATDGRGVLNALSAIARLVLARAEETVGRAASAAGAPAATPSAAASPPAAARPATGGVSGVPGSAMSAAAAPGRAEAAGGPVSVTATVAAEAAASGAARSRLTIGVPRTTGDGLIVPLLLHDGRGEEHRLTLAVRIELSAADAAAATTAGNDPAAGPAARPAAVGASGARGARPRGVAS